MNFSTFNISQSSTIFPFGSAKHVFSTDTAGVMVDVGDDDDAHIEYYI